MGEEAAAGRYEPGIAFEEVKDDAMLDMSQTDSKEFWLIQWIKDKDFDVSNFHGKKISLELQKDGNLGSLESSSGKSYDLVSFAYQQPNATVFLPSGSETKAVGKISRRVCLFGDRKYDELKRPSFGSLPPSSKESAEKPSSGNALAVKKKASRKRKKKDVSHLVAAVSSKDCNSQGSVGSMSMQQTPERNKQRKDENAVGPTREAARDVSGNASEGRDCRDAQSNTAAEKPQTTPEKPPEKKVKTAEQ